MSKNYIFSSESVGEGHPDKVCDTISDAVLDACLTQDPRSRVACETYAKSNLVVVGGEITTKAKLDYNAIARQAIRDIGYTHEDDVFHADRVLNPLGGGDEIGEHDAVHGAAADRRQCAGELVVASPFRGDRVAVPQHCRAEQAEQVDDREDHEQQRH